VISAFRTQGSEGSTAESRDSWGAAVLSIVLQDGVFQYAANMLVKQ